MKESVAHLTSKNNPLLKQIRRIASGANRDREDLVLAEGTRVLEEVVKSGCTIEAVVLSETFGSDARESALLEHWTRWRIRLYRAKAALFHSLSCLSTDQGALALVHVPDMPLPKECAHNTTILYACGVQDPGNLGTLIRTAAASGATFVCTSTGTVSARNPKTIRSSAGVFFHHPPVEHISPDSFIRFCRKNSIPIYRTDMLHGIPYIRADLASSCAILLGNEGRGVMEDSFAKLPSLHIPMENGIESLNVALAGAVLLFEAARQRSLKKS